MRQRGILLTCDRCGKTEFLKRLPDMHLRHDEHYNCIDGEAYQQPESGWIERYFRDGERKDLCPNCSKIFEEFMQEFMAEESIG